MKKKSYGKKFGEKSKEKQRGVVNYEKKERVKEIGDSPINEKEKGNKRIRQYSMKDSIKGGIRRIQPTP